VQANERVEMILEHHHHVHAAQQFAQHDALVDALAMPMRIARVAYFFPVLERGALIIAPEFGT